MRSFEICWFEFHLPRTIIPALTIAMAVYIIGMDSYEYYWI